MLLQVYHDLKEKNDLAAAFEKASVLSGKPLYYLIKG